MNNFALLIAIGALGGLFSGLLGVGAGTVFIPGLIFLASLSQHVAQGTALGAMIPVVFVGYLQYRRQKYIDYRISAILTAGTIAGVWVGASLALKLPGQTLKQLFGIFLLLIGIKMLLSIKEKL